MLPRIHSAQHVPHVLLPVLLAHSQRECGVAAASEGTYRAVGALESLREVERLPRTPLLVLGETDGVVRVVVALRTEIREPRLRAALQVLRQQSVRPPDRRVRMVVRSECADAAVHAELMPDWPVHDAHGCRGR